MNKRASLMGIAIFILIALLASAAFLSAPRGRDTITLREPLYNSFDQVTGSWWKDDLASNGDNNKPIYTSFDLVTGSWWDDELAARTDGNQGVYTRFDQVTGSWWESEAVEEKIEQGLYTSFDQVTGSWWESYSE